ncbi:DJ-1 domain InhA-type [Penicillium samsonianum]|uniref:DJ-1 domain InhA-type n=1 Tax=Penicillium samsonianum TaxID=1882272 RepID=UPI0025470AF8|nr:DJ-1 domain InhA-type [Penicillium samsonianum]KAJ6131768.1 DJ-1 domain InhA-type [Penicillium samsonianum]
MAPIQFGVIMIPFQLTDVAGPLDVLSSSSGPYLRGMGNLDLAEHGIDIEFHYIGEGMDPVIHSAGFKSQPTTTLSACPKLDYLLIGGPEPNYLKTIPPAIASFVCERADEVKTVFTTCTGGIFASVLGLLDGLNATTNHEVMPLARELAPNVKWTTEKNWVVDGKFWTAGGACVGMDMMAHWVIENYGREVAEAGFAALAYEPRDVDGKQVALTRHVSK